MELRDPAIDDLKGRVLAARDRLRLLPAAQLAVGPVNPETGEAWDRLHILGHVAQMLPFWTRQVRQAVRGAPIGRDDGERLQRQAAVDSSHTRKESALRKSIDVSCGRLVSQLDRFADADLGRPLQRAQGGEITLAEALETFLVGHLEEHLEQLGSLG